MVDKTEPADHHQYFMVTFRPDGMKFFIAAVGFYKALLESDLRMVKEDPDLAVLLPGEGEATSRVQYEIDKATRLHDWLKGELEKAGNDSFGMEISLSHGAARYMKTAGQLYLNKLRLHREALASKPNVSLHMLGEVDQRIIRFEEILQSGIFANATPMKFLVGEVVPERAGEGGADLDKAELSNVPKPATVVIDSIEILDQQLKSRCMDLFQQFSDGGEHDRLDTVLSVATTVLEDRIRNRSGADNSLSGRKLVSFAFKPAAPRLRVSTDADKQTAALNLFSGVFGLIRNDVHHNLVDGLQPPRVLQIVGMVDYLLSVVDAAERVRAEDE